MSEGDDTVTVELTLPRGLADALVEVHDELAEKQRERLSSGRGRRGWDTEELTEHNERALDAKLARLLVKEARSHPPVRSALRDLRESRR